MIKEMNAQKARDMLLYVADKIIEAKPMLTEVDSAIGDGDHGIGMEVGFKKVKEKITGVDFDSVNKVFTTAGKAMLLSMGGASGVIFSSMITGGFKEMPETTVLDTTNFAESMQKALEAIKARGGAQLGDKTMIDALEPAVDSMKADTNGDFVEFFANAEKAAEEGVEKTKNYEAKFGRAKSLMERSIGHQDAGATSVYIILKSMKEFVANQN